MADWTGRVVLQAPDGTVFSRPLPALLSTNESGVVRLDHVGHALIKTAEEVFLKMLKRYEQQESEERKEITAALNEIAPSPPDSA